MPSQTELSKQKVFQAESRVNELANDSKYRGEKVGKERKKKAVGSEAQHGKHAQPSMVRRDCWWPLGLDGAERSR